MNPRISLETPRLVLRLPHPSDVRTVHGAICDSMDELKQFMPAALKGQTQRQTRDYIYTQMALFVQDEVMMFALFERATQECVGVIELALRVPRIPSYEVSFWIRTPASGRGYMSEALAAVTRWAFETLKAQRVFLRCEPANVACQRTAEHVGFFREGWLKNDAISVDGRTPVDTLIYGHTPVSWGVWAAKILAGV